MGRATGFVSAAQASVPNTGTGTSVQKFLVPAGHAWRPQLIAVTLATSSEVGDRNIVVHFQDGATNIIGMARMKLTGGGCLVHADETRAFMFGAGYPEEADFDGYSSPVTVRVPMPEIVLPAGYSIWVRDVAAIDDSDDDMTVRILYEDMVE